MKSNYYMEKVMEYVKPFLMAVFTFLTPINGLLGLLFLAVLIDTLFAIYVSIKQRGWSSFQSVILRKGIGAKLLFYLGTVILAFLIDKYIVKIFTNETPSFFRVLGSHSVNLYYGKQFG